MYLKIYSIDSLKILQNSNSFYELQILYIIYCDMKL